VGPDGGHVVRLGGVLVRVLLGAEKLAVARVFGSLIAASSSSAAARLRIARCICSRIGVAESKSLTRFCAVAHGGIVAMWLAGTTLPVCAEPASAHAATAAIPPISTPVDNQNRWNMVALLGSVDEIARRMGPLLTRCGLVSRPRFEQTGAPRAAGDMRRRGTWSFFALRRPQ
jgi:hypothetical protein